MAGAVLKFDSKRDPRKVLLRRTRRIVEAVSTPGWSSRGVELGEIVNVSNQLLFILCADLEIPPNKRRNLNRKLLKLERKYRLRA